MNFAFASIYNIIGIPIGTYTGAKKYWHPYLIDTIEMTSLWMELKYVKSATRLLQRI